jgi:hypothetical protein
MRGQKGAVRRSKSLKPFLVNQILTFMPVFGKILFTCPQRAVMPDEAATFSKCCKAKAAAPFPA